MSPLTEPWYRKLLWVSVVIGTVGGLVAVVYSGITGFGIDQSSPSGEPTAELVVRTMVVDTARRCGGRGRDSTAIGMEGPGGSARGDRNGAIGWVDPNGAPALVMVSAVSLFAGASLGPSFGIVVAGAGLGAWIVRRFGLEDEHGVDFSVAGMAGSLGGVFSAPLFGSILASNSRPCRNSRMWRRSYPSSPQRPSATSCSSASPAPSCSMRSKSMAMCTRTSISSMPSDSASRRLPYCSSSP